MAVTILGERLTWRLLAGSSGIVAGLFLVIYALHRYVQTLRLPTIILSHLMTGLQGSCCTSTGAPLAGTREPV